MPLNRPNKMRNGRTQYVERHQKAGLKRNHALPAVTKTASAICDNVEERYQANAVIAPIMTDLVGKWWFSGGSNIGIFHYLENCS